MKAGMHGRGDGEGPRAGGFTLVELLVAVALVGGLAGLLMAGLAGDRGPALMAGQATLSQVVTAARNRAVASGLSTRLLVQHDASSALAAERFLRFLALQEFRDGRWRTVQTTSLPAAVRVVPHQARSPAGLFPDESVWRRRDGTRLHSSALFRPLVQAQVDAPAAEYWAELVFSGHGTTGTAGQLVLGSVRPAALPDRQSAPVVFTGPEQVRGLQLSVYGLALAIDHREGF